MMVELFFGMFNRIVRKQRFCHLNIFFSVAIFAELDVDNATPLTSIIAMNAQK
jgi:hypothetical protein